MYELLDQHRMFHPTCLDDFKNLKDLLDRFEVRTSSCVQKLNSSSFTHHLALFYLCCCDKTVRETLSPGQYCCIQVFFDGMTVALYHITTGSGEGCCIHEVQQIHEDSRQQQDGQMGKQERVTCSQVQLTRLIPTTVRFFT